MTLQIPTIVTTHISNDAKSSERAENCKNPNKTKVRFTQKNRNSKIHRIHHHHLFLSLTRLSDPDRAAEVTICFWGARSTRSRGNFLRTTAA